MGPGLLASSIPPNSAAPSSIFKLSRHPYETFAAKVFQSEPEMQKLCTWRDQTREGNDFGCDVSVLLPLNFCDGTVRHDDGSLPNLQDDAERNRQRKLYLRLPSVGAVYGARADP